MPESANPATVPPPSPILAPSAELLARDPHRVVDLESLLGRRSPAPVSLVDPANLRRLALEHPAGGFLCDLVELFSTDTSQRVGAMRVAVEQDDVLLLRAQAHAVRGAGALVGALALTGICAELERARGAEVSADAGALIDRLEWTLVRSADELRALVCA